MATLTASNESPTAAEVDVLVIAVAKGEDGPVPQPGSDRTVLALPSWARGRLVLRTRQPPEHGHSSRSFADMAALGP